MCADFGCPEDERRSRFSFKTAQPFDREAAWVRASGQRDEHQLRRGDFDARFKINDIEPAFPFEQVGQLILRRADIPRLLSIGA
jgi:hypothetical protein